MPAVYHITISRRRRRTAPPERRFVSIRGVAIGAVAFFSSLLAFGVIVAAFLLISITSGLPSIDALPALFEGENSLLRNPTRIYDRTDSHLIATLENPASIGHNYLRVGGNGQDSFPPELIDAVIAALDPDFWEHSGFSWSTAPERQTLAELLVSNYLLWNEPPSLQRTFRQRILAAQTTVRFGREKILEWYLNSADFGHLIRGADAAALTYFGKPASRLSVAESAMLAAIAAAPAINPIDALPAAQENKDRLLEKLYEQGQISREQFIESQEQLLVFRKDFEQKDNFTQAFTEYLIHQLQVLLPASRLEAGGYKIVSTLDFDLQSQAACAAALHLSRIQSTSVSPQAERSLDDCEASRLLPSPTKWAVGNPSSLGAHVVVLDSDTGELLAMVDQGGSGVKPASPPGRPAGSLLTPFIYLTAFTRGMSPGTMVWDIPANLTEGAADLENPDGNFHGPIRIRTALASDYLVPAVKILEQIGPDQVWRTAQQSGLRSLEIPVGPDALRLPFENGQVPLLEISHAYAVFANRGDLAGIVYEPDPQNADSSEVYPLSVLKITDLSGKIVLDCSGESGGCRRTNRRLITSQLAYLMTSILTDEAARWPSLGHPNLLEIGRPSGAKIGRTAAGLDTWTVGFTPELVVGVWVGSPKPELRIPEEWATGLWHAIIQYASREYPVVDWAMPPGISRLNVCDPSGLLPTADCPSIVSEIFLNGSEPTHVDTLYKSIQINRETGRLATIFTPPEFVDRQVVMVVPSEAQSWAVAAGIPTPPEDYDVVEAPAAKNPNVQITSPSLFEHVSGIVPVTGRAAGPGFESYRLQYGQGLNPDTWSQLGENQTEPIIDGRLGLWDTSGLTGLYVLQLLVIRADDQVESATIQVSVDNEPPEITIRFPRDGEEITSSATGSIPLEVDASDALELAGVEFFMDGELVASLNSPPFAFPWQIVFGEHTFSARAYDRAGNTAEAAVRFKVNR